MKETPAIWPPDEPCVDPSMAEPDPNEVLVSINDTLYPEEISDPPSDARVPLGQALVSIRKVVDVNPLVGLYDQETPLRLIEPLREAARTQNPYKILAAAGAAFFRAQNPMPDSSPTLDERLGRALADLAVTGRMSYTRLQRRPLIEASLHEVTRATLAHESVRATPELIANAVSPALDRAFAVAWALRGPADQRAALRKDLGWIAVSSDDDKPHRPVNIPGTTYEQFEIPVTVAVPGPPAHNLTVQTRFLIASAEDPAAAPITPLSRELPPDPVPHIPSGHQVILFLHGHSSGAEEALPVIPDILRAGLDRGRKYSVISFDLPNNGYSQTFDHETVADRNGTSWPSDPLDSRPIHAPILDYIENFIVAFVDALDAITPIKNRFAGVIGGSLGGNLGLRLGQRDNTKSPWLNAGIVSWSAASVWKPMVNSYFNSVAPGICWSRAVDPEVANSRRDYFTSVFNKPAVWTTGPRTQPQMWYRDSWEPCKAHHIRESQISRQEIYDVNFRQWHWRVAGEQLIFSHNDHVDHDNTKPFRFELNNKVPQLLIAGRMDNFPGTQIFNCTLKLAEWMVNTPGRSLFLEDTGHSMHIERPKFIAGQIADFLFMALGGLAFCDDQKKLISTWNPLALGTQGFALRQNTPCRVYDLPVLNHFDHRVEVTAIRITSPADLPGAPVFTATAQLPFSIGPAQPSWISVQYNGTKSGPLTGFVEVECDDTSNPITRIPLAGTVEAINQPQLWCTPDSLDFGTVAVGTAVWKEVTVENVGDGDSRFANIEISPAGPFTVHPDYPALSMPTGVGSTSSVVIRVLYEPTAAGASVATLAIDETSADPLYRRRYEMPLTAQATMPSIFLAGGARRWIHGLPGQPDVPMRDIELRSLDFGVVPPDKTSIVSFWIRNVGNAALTVQGVIENMRGSFSVVDPNIFPIVLPANGEMEVPCSFLAPHASGQSVASSLRVLSDDPLRADSGDPQVPGAVLEVTGRSGGPSLLDPVEFEQGIVAIDPPAALTFTFRSDGTDAVTVRQVEFFDVNPGTNFSVSTAPQLPARVDPATELTLTVTCIANAPGMYEADLVVTHNGNPNSTSQVRLRAIVA
ncbi:MAG: choice-of-anchor D domain-containing protein [Ilumatobacteraceae bacterium]